MKKNTSTIVLITIIVALVFGLGGFFIGKTIYENKQVKNEDTNKEQEQFEENVTEEQNEQFEEQKELVEKEENNEEEKIVFSNIPAELKSASSSSCQKMFSKLNFSTSLKNMYCYCDVCYKNANGVISYFMYDYNNTLETLRDNESFADDLINNEDEKGFVWDIYTLSLSNGKISVIKNGEESSKYYLSGISNVKSFRVTYSVQDDNNYQLYVLHNNGIVYRYDFFYQKKKAVKAKLVYKNVSDFDIFEANDYRNKYKNCVKKLDLTPGQNIMIALHTKDGKTLFGRP